MTGVGRRRAERSRRGAHGSAALRGETAGGGDILAGGTTKAPPGPGPGPSPGPAPGPWHQRSPEMAAGGRGMRVRARAPRGVPASQRRLPGASGRQGLRCFVGGARRLAGPRPPGAVACPPSVLSVRESSAWLLAVRPGPGWLSATWSSRQEILWSMLKTPPPPPATGCRGLSCALLGGLSCFLGRGLEPQRRGRTEQGGDS